MVELGVLPTATAHHVAQDRDQKLVLIEGVRGGSSGVSNVSSAPALCISTPGERCSVLGHAEDHTSATKAAQALDTLEASMNYADVETDYLPYFSEPESRIRSRTRNMWS
ncbi:uncharacterized protein PG986_006249 [Apiospora aurea]|uniref:Uncharacterized protein n=1 Tax=Apiospora aurea TaxID=335848 RepID=A0ABR1QKN2_9PEZI